jgi:hypothetical protein
MSDKLTEEDRKRIDTCRALQHLQSAKEFISTGIKSRKEAVIIHKIDEAILWLGELLSKEKRL